MAAAVERPGALQPGFDERGIVLLRPRHADEAAAGKAGARFLDAAEELEIGGLEAVVLDQHFSHRAVPRMPGRSVVDGPELHERNLSHGWDSASYRSIAGQCTLR